MDDLFAPPAYAWQRLDPGYLKLRRLTTPSAPALFGLIVGGVAWFLTGLWWLAAILWALTVAGVVWRLWIVRRNYYSWGYVEREDDLYITSGVLFRRLVAVPYGRMQLVEVESGPLERSFGLASVTLKTASPETNATIPGLAPDEATRLRDRLTELGEARSSGL